MTLTNVHGESELTVYFDKLPVQYSELTGRVTSKNEVQLAWLTYQERNNKEFVIERSSDGRHFQAVGVVASRATDGDSHEKLQYEFVDPNFIGGNVYYRFQQIDFDGSRSYSNVVSLNRTASASSFSMKAFPNPATDKLQIQLNGERASQGVITITDLSGKIVKQFATKDSDTELDISSLSSGNYLISYQDGQNHSTLKLSKQ